MRCRYLASLTKKNTLELTWPGLCSDTEKEGSGSYALSNTQLRIQNLSVSVFMSVT